MSSPGGYQPMQSVNQGSSGTMTDWKAMGAGEDEPGSVRRRPVERLAELGVAERGGGELGDQRAGRADLVDLAGGREVHKFILGYTNEGIIQIVITLVTCGAGSIVGLVEGIIYLTKSDEDFVRTYIQGKKAWF